MSAFEFVAVTQERIEMFAMLEKALGRKVYSVQKTDYSTMIITEASRNYVRSHDGKIIELGSSKAVEGMLIEEAYEMASVLPNGSYCH